MLRARFEPTDNIVTSSPRNPQLSEMLCIAQKTADLKAAANTRYLAKLADSEYKSALYAGKISSLQYIAMLNGNARTLKEADKLEAKWRIASTA
jgi:hypothetical protein